MIHRKKRSLATIALEIVMLALVVVMVIPFYYIVVNTFKTASESAYYPLALPQHLMLDNYVYAFGKMLFFNCFKNNLIVTAFSVTGIVLLCSLAAYPISRRSNKINSFLKFYFLAGLMVPMQALLLPLYKIMQFFHIINKLHGVIILYIAGGSAFNIFLYQGFLKSSVPLEIEESAAIDGCTVWKRFWYIVFPLMKPVTATVIVYNTIIVWNDFLYPFLFLQSRRNSTMVLEIYRNVNTLSVDWIPLITMMVLTLLPVFVFFVFMQNYIVKGITGGSLKG